MMCLSWNYYYLYHLYKKILLDDKNGNYVLESLHGAQRGPREEVQGLSMLNMTCLHSRLQSQESL